jgi:hypothetical protein
VFEGSHGLNLLIATAMAHRQEPQMQLLTPERVSAQTHSRSKGPSITKRKEGLHAAPLTPRSAGDNADL